MIICNSRFSDTNSEWIQSNRGVVSASQRVSMCMEEEKTAQSSSWTIKANASSDTYFNADPLMR